MWAESEGMPRGQVKVTQDASLQSLVWGAVSARSRVSTAASSAFLPSFPSSALSLPSVSLALPY